MGAPARSDEVTVHLSTADLEWVSCRARDLGTTIPSVVAELVRSARESDGSETSECTKAALDYLGEAARFTAAEKEAILHELRDED